MRPDSLLKLLIVWFVMDLLFGAVTSSGQPVALTAEASNPLLQQVHADANSSAAFLPDGAALQTAYEEQRRLAWGEAGAWGADSVLFFPVRVGEPDPTPQFRPLKQVMPDLPGMRMTWDYEALARAGHQRPASGAAPLLAMSLLLLATRRR